MADRGGRGERAGDEAMFLDENAVCLCEQEEEGEVRLTWREANKERERRRVADRGGRGERAGDEAELPKAVVLEAVIADENVVCEGLSEQEEEGDGGGDAAHGEGARPGGRLVDLRL